MYLNNGISIFKQKKQRKSSNYSESNILNKDEF